MKDKISQELLSKTLRLTKEHEGLSLKLYKCTSGYQTIGYGRNMDTTGLRNELEASFLLEEDIKFFHNFLQFRFSWFDGLSLNRKIALVNMCFMGASNLLTFKRMIAALEAGNYELAADELLDSKYAVQVGQRAITLADIMRTDEIG